MKGEECIRNSICVECEREIDSEYGISGKCKCICHTFV